MAATRTAKAITTKLTLERETKGTFVFTSDDEDAAVTTLYVRKSAMDEAPDSITLTIK
jgi:hypothetical protein